MIWPRTKWGPIAWNMLHTFSINNNFKISNNKKHLYYLFYSTFSYIIPCLECSEHYSNIIFNLKILDEKKINRLYLIKWICDVHNITNKALKKPILKYNECIECNEKIKNKEIFLFIETIYKNFDYNKISLYKFDQVYNFFINFCILYPDINIKKNLKKIFKLTKFNKINTPKGFEEWFFDNKDKLKNIFFYEQ
jgi:hypothetical protein